MSRGKYAVRAANKRAYAHHATAEELRNDLDAATREIEHLTKQLAVTQNAVNDTIARTVRDELRQERARMKAAMRDNTLAAKNEIQAAAKIVADRDAAIAEKLGVALRGLFARAVELAGEALIDTEEAIVINEVFEDLGVKMAGGTLRSIVGIGSHGQIASANGVSIKINARKLQRRSVKQVERCRRENLAKMDRKPSGE